MVVLNVGPLTSVADYFLICSGDSERQVKAISEGIDAALAKAGQSPFSIEGLKNLNWVLMDFSDLVVHIFLPDARQFYRLERLWGDAQKLPLRNPSGKGPSELGSPWTGKSSQGIP